MRPSCLLTGTVAVLLALAGCGSDGDPADSSTTAGTATTAPTADASSTTADTSDTTSTTAESEPTSPPSTAALADVGPEWFSSPTRNIGCMITDDEARCDISEYTWKPPRKPADCEFDWGGSLFVAASGAEVGCVSDTVMGAEDVLAYGATARRGAFERTSASTGMTCRHRRSGHGFTLSRSSYKLF